MVVCWFWFIRLMFFSGLFSLSIFRSSTNDFNSDSKNDDHVDCSRVNEEIFKGFINYKFSNTGYYKLSINNYNKENIDRKKAIILEKILKNKIYIDIRRERPVGNALCDIFDIKTSSIKIFGPEGSDCLYKGIYNLDTSPKELQFILSDFNCKRSGFTGCETNHTSLGLWIYDPNKELNNFELVEIITKNNECKLVEKINKRLGERQLWKYIPYLFLGGFIFFAFVGLLFWLFNSDDEVYKNKRGRKKMRKINGMDNGSRARRVRKNRVRNINRGRNRINKNRNIKKKLGKFAQKKKARK